MREDLRWEDVRSRAVVLGEMDGIAQKEADGPEGGWSVLRVVNLTGEHSRDSSRTLLEGVAVQDSRTSQAQRNRE